MRKGIKLGIGITGLLSMVYYLSVQGKVCNSYSEIAVEDNIVNAQGGWPHMH
ncbi:hypothetical protein [Oceanobacillus sp. CF4.6]|uniref:hypothetical protein n=1 Tax=Oceanobacillus sp. CF4.6 TaxID=3373080 RepID=UPI003EE637A4